MLGSLPIFKLKNEGDISQRLITKGFRDFHQVIKHVWALAYGRNSNPLNYKVILCEEKGTCSTKHAFLAQLCIEQGVNEISLMIGIYEMTENNTPGVGHGLQEYELHSLPEAHCYLIYNNERYDFTRVVAQSEAIEPFLSERKIKPSQIGEYKKQFHRSFIPEWLAMHNLNQRFNLDRIWDIREECIRELSKS